MAEVNFFRIPEVSLSSNNGRKMPILGLGTASWPFGEFESTKLAVLEAIKIGYRHFDTASLYLSEKPVGEALAEALNLGFIKSRAELFITSKLWCSDAHQDLVLPALKKSLQNLKLECLDLYLIHWPMSLKPGPYEFPLNKEDFLPMDFKVVWAAMEECQSLGLTKAIGVSNFTCKKIGDLLAHAKIPPAVNQVEINPLWQQKTLRKLCRSKGIMLTAYSVLGAKGTVWGSNKVLECEKLKEIAEARGKTIAQVCLRWVYEQGDIVLVKSFNRERMKENLDIFDWSLSKEDSKKISEIPQTRTVLAEDFISAANGPFHSIEEVWDGEL